MKLPPLIIFLLFVSVTAVNGDEKWGYQLTEKTLFENEIDGHDCEKLTVEKERSQGSGLNI
jgi:hypothetical protein